MRKGPWKLVHMGVRTESPRFELYNLDSDPGEVEDIAAEHPDIVESLKTIMQEAHIPNPDFPLLPGE